MGLSLSVDGRNDDVNESHYIDDPQYRPVVLRPSCIASQKCARAMDEPPAKPFSSPAESNWTGVLFAPIPPVIVLTPSKTFHASSERSKKKINNTGLWPSSDFMTSIRYYNFVHVDTRTNQRTTNNKKKPFGNLVRSSNSNDLIGLFVCSCTKVALGCRFDFPFQCETDVIIVGINQHVTRIAHVGVGVCIFLQVCGCGYIASRIKAKWVRVVAWVRYWLDNRKQVLGRRNQYAKKIYNVHENMS